MTEDLHIVIGSGPAGVSAAKALLTRGRSVMMVDGGKRLEPAAAARQADLAATNPGGWSEQTRDDWMAPQYATPPGQVRRYGSDFAMEPGASTFADAPGWMALRASRAAGGLSNLWGAAVLPYGEKDMAGWPVTTEDLAPHYHAVAEFLSVAGIPDTLEPLFPSLPMAGRGAIEPAPQAKELLRRLDGKRAALAAMGVHGGQARQAVDASCRRCGLCLHGCPYRLIWSAADTLADLLWHPGFTYRSGAVVKRITEAEGVTLHLEDGTEITGTRAYLGAGVLETARILLASDPSLVELTLKDSQHAFLPMLHRWANATRPDRGPFHTLPQAFVEIDAPEVSPFLVHAQIYTWNEYFPRDLVQNYARKLPLSAPFFTALARRLIVAQMFLHSDHSHRIALKLAPDGRLLPRLETNPTVEGTLKQAVRHMGKAMSRLGLLPLTFAARPGAPGSSFHAGASVPMAEAAGKGQSDILGRPAGWQRLHLIDASCLPAIPATTITFSVMANAHRIGSLAP
ncbi:MAG TPA: FAD-binding protein [Albidovulum sp.]|uniref:FAD-binding protein n=1 Tax=Albidovulum sp. TaxID=1872424 RepID=UPI002C9A0EEB|nr:FAD-binding protein [Albidovulum sp.]